MSSHRDRLQALGPSLRKGYPLAARLTNRQFETLLHELGRVPLRDDDGAAAAILSPSVDVDHR